jgi:uncharacterized protein YbaR (Trm112 family)
MTDSTPGIPAAVRAVLACPKCHGPLVDRPDGRALECRNCGLAYPIRDGLPVLLVESAVAITP